MRAFLAFEVPRQVKDHVRNIAGKMARSVDGVKWVREEGIHITLKFFGEIERERALQFRDALQHIAGQYSSFEASLLGVDAFPDRRRARVIVVKLEKGVDNLRSIFNDIEVSLSAMGIEREPRLFTPHLTLGRRKIPAPLLERAIPPVEKGDFVLESLILFESVLTREGSIYTPLWELKLGGGHG
jgi:RNA 2',3'-cyclic 3'-phosphodiesterase